MLPTGTYIFKVLGIYIFGIYKKFGIYLVYFCRKVDLRLYTKLSVIVQSLSRETIVVLKLHLKLLVILLNTGVNVCFG